MPASDWALIDELRGNLSRSEWIRQTARCIKEKTDLMKFTAIHEQAAKCPQDYEQAGSNFADWCNHPDIKELSALLSKAGYPALSQAVIRGKMWVNTIVRCPAEELDVQLDLSESEASIQQSS